MQCASLNHTPCRTYWIYWIAYNSFIQIASRSWFSLSFFLALLSFGFSFVHFYAFRHSYGFASYFVTNFLIIICVNLCIAQQNDRSALSSIRYGWCRYKQVNKIQPWYQTCINSIHDSNHFTCLEWSQFHFVCLLNELNAGSDYNFVFL